MKTQEPERRRAPRARADFPIDLWADGTVAARLENISTAGLCCVVGKAIPELSLARTTIELPAGQTPATRKYELEGAVVRCEPREEGDYEVAIFFQFPPPEAQELITDYVERQAGRRNTTDS